ncbi:MAG: hypothetical protein H6704_12700 [Myxococcales bacterium]|nr:hypothetical protein [Myxococcales bacterium]
MRGAAVALALLALVGGCDDGGGDAAPAPPEDAAPPPADAWPPLPATQPCAPGDFDFDALPAVEARAVLRALRGEGAVDLIEGPGGWWVGHADGRVRWVPVGGSATAPVTVLEVEGELVGLAVARDDGTAARLFVATRGADGLAVTVHPIVRPEGPVDARAVATLWRGEGAGGGVQLDGEAVFVAAAGGLLRLDATTGEPAADNPTAGEAVWAAGLDAPGRCVVDDGRAWCLDGGAVKVASPGGRFDVVAEACADAVGGFVYRSLDDPELWGAYLYACGETVRGARVVDDGVRVADLAALDGKPSTFARDGGGRVLAIVDGASPGRLQVAAPDRALGMPARLSDTGCFEDVPSLRPAPGVVPYDVASPLWTDGAHKRRWLALPAGERVTVDDVGPWDFPQNAMLIKDFAFTGADGVRRSVETRVMVRRPFGFSFHTYRWDADGQDATLLTGDMAEAIEVEVRRDGEAATLPYLFPSRADCQTCHNPRALRVLGPTTQQMVRPIEVAGAVVDQGEALFAHGVLDRAPGGAGMPDPSDATAPLADRARAYLHANCAHCHQPDGWTPPELGLDLRYTTPLAETGACGVPLKYSAFGIAGDLRLDPGRPGNSNLLQRMLTRGVGQMPVAATAWVDPVGVEVVGAWIAGLEGCP